MYDSKIIIGCMSWGAWGSQFSTSEQIQMIEFCLENGNKVFDHADIYGGYTTESEFGTALVESKIERSSIQVISKCGIQIVGTARKSNIVKHYDYSKEYIIKSAEQSLKNLKTDYLDTFLLHRPSPLMELEEIAEAVYKLQESNKIINFGVSNFSPSQIELLSSKIPVLVNQIEFSLTNNTAMQNGILDQMIQRKIQGLCWSPLGIVFKEKTDQTERIVKLLDFLSEKYNASADTLLLSWILKHPANILPIIGTTKKERIINANKALAINLELQDWFLMLEASNGMRVA